MQKALALLRTKIMDKLRRESGSNGRMGVVSRKEKVDVYASYDFQMAYFFRKMADRHAVLLKDKSLVFPDSSEAMPVTADPKAGNAPIPSASDRPSKRRRLDSPGLEQNGGSDLFLGESGTDGPSAEQAEVVVKAEVDEEDEALLHAGPGADGQVDEDDDFSAALQHPSLQTEDELLDEAQRMKPRLRVKYSGFRIFGKMLVVVIEPSKSMIADHPELFGAAPSAEVRQLSVTPMPGGGVSRAGSRAGSTTQSRLTSVRAPSIAGLSANRAAREGSRRDSRAPSPGIGATLFLGNTPTPEPESRRFGSRGVSRAMSATPGPSLGPTPRTRDGSPEGRTSELASAINQRGLQTIRKLPPVPTFADAEKQQNLIRQVEEDRNEDNDTGAQMVQRRARDSQAPSPTPEPVAASRARASSIMPRKASQQGTDDADVQTGDGEVDIGMQFDFGEGGQDEGEVGPEDSDEDEAPTGFALATQMMEAGDQAGQGGTDVDYAE